MGLRERKKAETRERIADVAAGLFAARGYDEVSVVDVARAAEVSDQTIYNYFPTKQDLVLDRAEEIRERYGRVVRERATGTSPAAALRPLVLEDIDRLRLEPPELARGEFPAQCLVSPVLRRFALEERERQADAITASLAATDPEVPTIVARAHAAALVSVVQTITDAIGAAVLASDRSDPLVARLIHDATDALDDLDRTFRSVTTARTGNA
ncbi:TetR/AcrR family transcriptional regulator [Cryptosporangium arvum]|uniref:Transcriptional regulator n=1 Tax=Cryptosporangium arvum DSM 44712 TaxID=927661 RepID=A0A010YK57_9ACTN|nr:TetR/AcrR family transcriptional regulator [Cryptosporangium arvum]EXG80620.1 transcriptional regulator [Cryptosporangium arvum DSM 44712]